MHTLDWDEATETLYRISDREVRGFLESYAGGSVYGLSLFYHPYYGDVSLVANTLEYHRATFSDYCHRYGPADEETFKRNIGNWEYPAGLLHAIHPARTEFEALWRPFEDAYVQIADDQSAERLENMCVTTLARLVRDGAFVDARYIEGFIVLGPDERDEDILPQKARIDARLNRNGATPRAT